MVELRDGECQGSVRVLVPSRGVQESDSRCVGRTLRGRRKEAQGEQCLILTPFLFPSEGFNVFLTAFSSSITRAKVKDPTLKIHKEGIISYDL